MKIAFVGCGYVLDIYTRTIKAYPELVVCGVFDINPIRAKLASSYYSYKQYKSLSELLEDPEVQTVVNLTSIDSHYEVSYKALSHGKYVFSEKPTTTSVSKTKELFEIASKNNVRLYSAPCNLYSDTIRTLCNEVNDGLIGKPLIIYAELDDNPITKMGFDSVVSPTGAPWPILEEVKHGCTCEHIGYHLSWICCLLGPADRVVAYSSELLEDKISGNVKKFGVADYSVACLNFSCGATARITCSVVAPRNHSIQIIGEDGEMRTDGYRRFQSPVFHEEYTKKSLTARKFYTINKSPIMRKIFGLGGKKKKLCRHKYSYAVEKDFNYGSSLRAKMLNKLRRREVYSQDKILGISIMKDEIEKNKPQYLTPEFLTHVNEITLMVQEASIRGIAETPTTSFSKLGPIPGTYN